MSNPLIITFLLAMLVLGSNAQKLPAVQKESVWAPITVKIDGKAAEWGNKFQAYNSSTEIYYTISNDDNNLYLAIKAVDPDIINKFLWPA